MKRVLYLTLIESPYRVRFFNELSKFCDLTVLYERELSSNRNVEWAKSVKGAYCHTFLNGIKIGNEHSFSLRVFREILSNYDHIIIGCYNSPIQMLAILVMRLLRIPYILNLDGEAFLKGNSIKAKLKRFFIRGASSYLVAGEKAADSLRQQIGDKNIIPYYFSSLSESDVMSNATFSQEKRSDTILVVGQYFDYKGMDVALEVARMDKIFHYKFVGMGSRTEQFLKDFNDKIPPNVEVIPFLQKAEIEQEYKTCRLLILPSRQECWGLVVNEAASFGTPIVSTMGSGAAVEFLADAYPQLLAEPGKAESLYRCILSLNEIDKDGYSQFLLKKTQNYTIERSVRAHLFACGIFLGEK